MPVPGLEEDAAAKGGGRWRRLRWGLLDRTASLLDMNTLSVFAPVKALLHAFKGNRWALSPAPPSAGLHQTVYYVGYFILPCLQDTYMNFLL